MPPLIDPDNHLTRGYGELDTAIAKTWAGMAHFAGSGPEGKTCRECAFWQHEGYYSKSGLNAGRIKPSPCAKYRRLTRRTGEKIPHGAQACKYFEADPKPPSIGAP